MKTIGNSAISDQKESANVDDLDIESRTSTEKSDKIEQMITLYPESKNIEIQRVNEYLTLIANLMNLKKRRKVVTASR